MQHHQEEVNEGELQENEQVYNIHNQDNQQIATNGHRHSFVGQSFPLVTHSVIASQQPVGQQTPLTNHEVYELTQKSQQQVAATQLQKSPIGIPTAGSFKTLKRQSLYIKQHNRLERQGSVIVGTPGFRERYGEYTKAFLLSIIL